ncbi:hypothetical protein PIB30_061448, partial [Stylosanthes scabra]|nr:hypothetical protein [Stylosanthes scabra]
MSILVGGRGHVRAGFYDRRVCSRTRGYLLFRQISAQHPPSRVLTSHSCRIRRLIRSNLGKCTESY